MKLKSNRTISMTDKHNITNINNLNIDVEGSEIAILDTIELVCE